MALPHLTAQTGGSGAAALLVAATFSTFFCTAVNAYTLRLAYPLWQHVQPASFPALHEAYLRLLGPVSTFPHIIMFFTTTGLFWRRPAAFSLQQAGFLFATTSLVILLSAVIGGTVHGRLSQTGVLDDASMRQLLQLSWARTLLMLAASALLCRTLWLALRA